LFSSLVQLMSEVVLGVHPAVHAAYQPSNMAQAGTIHRKWHHMTRSLYLGLYPSHARLQRHDWRAPPGRYDPQGETR
jgi:hypothetical protein